MLSTAFIQGPEVTDFSRALSKYLNVEFVIPCGNGTDALQIAMMGLGLKSGDEVILPVHTYVATAEVIALLGLVPVFVDVNEHDFNIDTGALKSKITARTKAIVPVHLYGQCADMEPILQIAEQFNLYVIEDAAQALGAMYTFASREKKHAGTMATVGTTSFFPSKNLGCYGDGGAVFTNNKALAEKLRMIANHGQKVKYFHDIIGVNSRLDTLQAAILNVKLPHIDAYAQKRNEVATYYDQKLGDIDFIDIPVKASNSTHVYHQYTLKIKGRSRDQFRSFLEQHGIPSMIYYPVPLHLQKAYQKQDPGTGSFPIAERLSKTVLSLPIHTEMKEEELDYICNVIRKF